MMFRAVISLLFTLATAGTLLAEDEVERLAPQLQALGPNMLSDQQKEEYQSGLRDGLHRELQAANDRSSADWKKIQNRADWEAFRQPRIEALRESLGNFPVPPKKLNVVVTGTLAGDGFKIQNLVFETRERFWVTANLYLPAKPSDSMPGILICHSHHRPKEDGELQDMGMTWARAGCAVLIMDQLGHGERRQHPFISAEDYAGEFRVSRQDYYFRYDTGMQLHLIGDSLIGWMAWDLMRGVDLLLAQPDIDPKRIILLGAVAGGGDPAAVTAAIDDRITAAVPFNFGGPQPETRFPLPDDVETSFNYAGSGGWESTRNLRRSAADGFLPWVIVGGIAPRGLIFAHEFSWDRERDPVWKRLQKIYGFYDQPDRLGFAHGYGELRQSADEASHCNHIGPPHRKMIHPILREWFEIPVSAEDEYRARRSAEELQCLTDEAQRDLKPRKLTELLTELAKERIGSKQKKLADLSPAERRSMLRDEWTRILGDVDAADKPAVVTEMIDDKRIPGVTVDRVLMEVDEGIAVPMMLLLPEREAERQLPVVVAVSQSGKQAFLSERAEGLAELLNAGIAVCLPDLRDTGETCSDTSRGPFSTATGRSSTELMLGRTGVGSRLRDLRTILKYLRQRDDLDAKRISLWGESFAEVNKPDTDFKVPRRVDGWPSDSEPLGGLLALLGALYEDDIRAVYIQGGLVSFADVLKSQFVHIPHDVVIPGAIPAGDISQIVLAIAPRPVQLSGTVDGLNRLLPKETVMEQYRAAREAYQQLGKGDSLDITDAASAAEWLSQHAK